tara:strand:- start:80 stop:793 length:714 start_codon:yes stop_codon:yes gene_type:complete
MLPISIPVVLSQNTQDFPSPKLALKEPNGLLAIGGTLSMPQVIKAYECGVFPWFNEGDPIMWWSPSPRTLLYPSQFKLSRSLKQTLKKDITITVDCQFEQVIHYCSQLRKEDTWITNQMIEAYVQLHENGLAHSIEVWHEKKLIGGLYGLCFGHAFFGESMFHIKPNASKIALYALCHLPLPFTFDFIDCQLPSKHLHSLGAVDCTRATYLTLLKKTLLNKTEVGQWLVTPVIASSI